MIAWIVAGLVAVGSIGGLVWPLIKPTPPPTPTPPPPPLAFMYDYKHDDSETKITMSSRHGPDLSLVSNAGESAQSIGPRGVKLFDEEKRS